jgi:hypothetical protein
MLNTKHTDFPFFILLLFLSGTCKTLKLKTTKGTHTNFFQWKNSLLCVKMSEDSPQCVQSYSVSFCDNMNTSDSTPLLGADQSDDELDPSEDRTTLKPNHMSIQRESPIFISPTTKHLNKALSCYSSSCPVNSHDVSWCNAW